MMEGYNEILARGVLANEYNKLIEKAGRLSMLDEIEKEVANEVKNWGDIFKSPHDPNDFLKGRAFQSEIFLSVIRKKREELK